MLIDLEHINVDRFRVLSMSIDFGVLSMSIDLEFYQHEYTSKIYQQ